MEPLSHYLSPLLALAASDPLVAFLCVLVAFLLITTLFLSFRLSRFMKGSNGTNLEGTIHALDARARTLEAHAKTTEKALENLDGRLQGALRGIALERFDPFQNAGGQQSFSTALLNEHGNGVVISGIHVRDGVRVYAKEVVGFKSERELSEEEEKSIQQAQKNLTP